MSFAWPHLLWLIPLPLLLLLWRGLRHRRDLAAGAGAHILQAQAGATRVTVTTAATAPLASRRPRVWLAASLIFLLLALARPQWGRIEEQVFEQSREILIGLDLSRSMNAPDISPSRLDRAKLLTQALLDRLQGERVGLIVFSGTSFLQAPLSTDYEILREFLPELKPGFLPEGGTNFRSLLECALDSFSSEAGADRFLIILSDGEDLDESWRPLLSRLKERKVRIISLGIGTEQGAMIPDGEGGFVKDERGAVVKSRLASSTLQELAKESSGDYRDASTWVDLASVLRETVERGQQGSFTDKREARAIERYQWVLAPAFLCLLGSLLFEFPSRIRPRAIRNLSDLRSGANLRGVSLFLLLPTLLLLPEQSGAQEPAGTAAEAPLLLTVKRLSDKTNLSGADYAEFARRTVEWGQGLKNSQQPVPLGPVRDGLEAVDSGERQSPKAADWARLRSELEALREKQTPPEKQDQDKQGEQNKKEEDKESGQKQEQDKNQDQKREQQQKDEKQSGNGESPNQDQARDKQPEQKQQEGQPPKSAFGDMKDKPDNPPREAAPRPPEEMQKIGGRPKESVAEKADPSLVLPLQKLQKIKEEDSPAHLYELMKDKQETQPSNKKNW